jgi:hypothetical protein
MSRGNLFGEDRILDKKYSLFILSELLAGTQLGVVDKIEK